MDFTAVRHASGLLLLLVYVCALLHSHNMPSHFVCLASLQFDLDQPVYVNSIREPLERYASHVMCGHVHSDLPRLALVITISCTHTHKHTQYYYVRDNVQNSQRHLCPANKMQGTGLADCLNAVQAGNCTMTECSVTLYLTRFFCGNDGPCHDAESRASLREVRASGLVVC